jgi:hypothetical protein
MNAITRQEVAAFQKDLAETLKPLMKKYGVALTKQRASFDATGFSVKVEFIREGAEKERAAAQHDSYLIGRYGIKVGDTLITGRGQKFVVDGATRSEKFPLTGTMNGKGFRFSDKGLKREDGTPVVDKWDSATVHGAELLDRKGA